MISPRSRPPDQSTIAVSVLALLSVALLMPGAPLPSAPLASMVTMVSPSPSLVMHPIEQARDSPILVQPSVRPLHARAANGSTPLVVSFPRRPVVSPTEVGVAYSVTGGTPPYEVKINYDLGRLGYQSSGLPGGPNQSFSIPEGTGNGGTRYGVQTAEIVATDSSSAGASGNVSFLLGTAIITANRGSGPPWVTDVGTAISLTAPAEVGYPTGPDIHWTGLPPGCSPAENDNTVNLCTPTQAGAFNVSAVDTVVPSMPIWTNGTLLVAPQLHVTLVGPISGSPNLTYEYHVVVTGGSGPPLQYDWSGPSGPLIDPVDRNFTFPTPGVYHIWVAVTDPGTATVTSNTLLVNVTVPVPTPSPSPIFFSVPVLIIVCGAGVVAATVITAVLVKRARRRTY